MPLIRTIEEDEEIDILDEEDEEEEQLAPDGKRKPILNELDLDFGSDEDQDENPWDFSYARKIATKKDYGDATTIDQKITAKIGNKKIIVESDSEDNEDNEEEEEEEIIDDETNEQQNDSEDEDEEEIIQKSQKKLKPKKQIVNKSKKNNIKQNTKVDDGDDSDNNEEKNNAAKSYFEKPDPETNPVNSFIDLHLSRPLLKAVNILGYVVPTPIQAKTIPIAMQGKDICASAATGSGKTAAFVLPILERLLFRDRRLAMTRVLILLPTRELAVQCHSVVQKLGKFSEISAALVVGGLSNKLQEAALRRNPDVVIATPGRLIDHLRNAQSFCLDTIDILVLDEADRLLDLGFHAELEEIIRFCPKGRQTLLFSATMTEQVDRLASLSLNRPVRVSVNVKNAVAAGIVQEFIRIKNNRETYREAMLLALVTRTFKSHVLVFFKSKKSAHRMKIIFGLAGLKAAELHGDLTQNQRLEALEDFRDGKFDFLLATDLAARGLDILGIEVIINFAMPRTIEGYIHRVGRTARWGYTGKSVSFVGEQDRKILKQIVKNSKEKVKNRILPLTVVNEWKNKIDDLESDVGDIIGLERHERLMRITQMEMDKAKNKIEHYDEIVSRPPRTWFQNSSEKEENKKISFLEHVGDIDDSDDNNDNNNKQKNKGNKRKRDRNNNNDSEEEEEEEEEEEYMGKNKAAGARSRGPKNKEERLIRANKEMRKYDLKMQNRKNKKDDLAGMSRKKKRRVLTQREIDREDEKRAPQEARAQKISAKAIKKTMRDKRLGIATPSPMGNGRGGNGGGKRKKRRLLNDASNGNFGSEFKKAGLTTKSGSVGGSRGGGGGGPKAGSAKKKKGGGGAFGDDLTSLNKPRGTGLPLGKKRGVNAFKSKKRYKRR